MIVDRSKTGQELNYIKENFLDLPGIERFEAKDWIQLAAQHKKFLSTMQISNGLALREVSDNLPDEFKSKYATIAMAVMGFVTDLSEIKNSKADSDYFKTLVKIIKTDWKEFYDQTTNYFKAEFFEPAEDTKPRDTDREVKSIPAEGILSTRISEIKF